MNTGISILRWLYFSFKALECIRASVSFAGRPFSFFGVDFFVDLGAFGNCILVLYGVDTLSQ